MAPNITDATELFTLVVTVTAGAYATGDLIGGKLTLSNALRKETRGAIFHSAVITDASNNSADVDVLVWTDDPTNTTFTDNVTFVHDPVDLLLSGGFAPVTSHSSYSANNQSVATGINLALSNRTGNNDLFFAIVARSTPTFAATTDVQLRVGLLRD